MKNLLLIVLVFASFVGCASDVNIGGTAIDESKSTESNQKRLREQYPLPRMEKSLELANLIKRLERINNNNRIAYVYALSSDGHVVASWVINGKMSSLGSLLTNTEQAVAVRNGGNYHVMNLPSPDFDGSYGKNPEGSFFFDVKDQLAEIVLGGGMIICTETPMRINTPVSLSVIDNQEERKRFESAAKKKGSPEIKQ